MLKVNNQENRASINKCCYQSALNLDACFCNDCGKPLLRCAAFEECGGLVRPDGCCPVCFQPQLKLQAGSVNSATVGGALALSLVLANLSPVGRPVLVRSIRIREGRGEWNECELSWDRLDGGCSNPFTLMATRMDRVGTQRLEIVVVVSSRWRWREETFAFSTNLEIKVDEDKEMIVQQNIHYGSEGSQPGGTIYAPLRIESTDKSRSRKSESDDTAARILPLTRASVYERALGLRGTPEGLAVKRDTGFVWKGFEQGNSPFDSPIITADSLLTFGRSRTKNQKGTTDVRLLVFNKDGSLDEDASRSISREHFCVWIEKDRLMFRVESENGATVDGKSLNRGEVLELKNGSCFSPFLNQPDRLQLRINFSVEHKDVVGVTLWKLSGG